MRLTIEVAPRTRSELKAHAARRGLSIRAYLLDLARRDGVDAAAG